MTNDPVLKGFLERQCEEGMALAEASDLFELELLGPPPLAAYFVRMHCKGLVRRSGRVV